jgi:hypothetical protein
MDIQTYIKDAGEIWADIEDRNKNDSSFIKLNVDEQLDFYQKNYHQFTMTFPIVLRYMVQLRQFNKKAFIKFIKKMTSNPYKTELEYCERQADYVKYLYMELTPRYNTNEANDIWKQTYDMLSKEVDAFKKAEENVKQKLEKNNNFNSIEKRKELKEALGF